MKRTDFVTTFLSGLSFIIVSPLIVMLLLQWWFITMVGLVIFGIAAWILISNKSTFADNPRSDTEGDSLNFSPEVAMAIQETLSAPFCPQCGAKFFTTSDFFCTQCGDKRRQRPLSALMDINPE